MSDNNKHRIGFIHPDLGLGETRSSFPELPSFFMGDVRPGCELIRWSQAVPSDSSSMQLYVCKNEVMILRSSRPAMIVPDVLKRLAMVCLSTSLTTTSAS